MNDNGPLSLQEMTLDPPKTIKELEKESRLRVQADHAESVPKRDIRPDQPEISRLKNRSKNRLLIVGIIMLSVLIFLAWVGDWAYSHFFRITSPKSTQHIVATDADFGIGQQRRGMGLDDNLPRNDSKPLNPIDIVLPPLRVRKTFLNKSMALEPVSSTTRNRQGQAISRINEQVSDSGKLITSAQSYRPCPAQMVKNANGVLICPKDNDELSGIAAADPLTSKVQRITLDPDLYIPIDTYIPCTLQTRFVSDVGGWISCLISQDVYSQSNHVRLIPAGTRARGVYKTGTLNHGQARMFVMWTELRTPDQLKIPMIDSQVVGQLGEAGIDGWVDTHFWQRFGNALLLSTVQDVAAAASGSAPSRDRNTDYTENSRAAASEMAKTALENSINIPPTIYKNQGDILGIMTGADIDFSSVYRLKHQ